MAGNGLRGNRFWADTARKHPATPSAGQPAVWDGRHANRSGSECRLGHRQLGRVLLCLLLATGSSGPQTQGREPAAPPKRAKPPVWKPQDHQPFFADVLRDGLRGPRPIARPAPTTDSPSSATVLDLGAPADPATAAGWSQLVSAATLEDELKAIKARLDHALQSEGYFTGQGYREIRPHLSCAAVLFAVIAEYDGDVRWKKQARAASIAFGRLALNTKVGTAQVYREAVLRRQDLADLISGGTLSEATTAEFNWPDIADRRLLMQRLDGLLQEEITTAVSNPSGFSQGQTSLVHAAELTALLAQVLLTEGMPEADDAEYRTFCTELVEYARQLTQQTRQSNYDAARQSSGQIKNRCVGCHEVYRA